MRRRQLLTASAVAVAGLAGCGGSGGEASTESGGTDGGGTGSGSEGGGSMDLSTPTAAVTAFYDTLYGNDDIEGANELYHPDSQAPAIKAEDFEPFGGIGSIGAEVAGTEVVSQESGRARVHVDVDYNTPAGSATNTDWFVFRQQDGEWLVSLWLPKSARDEMEEGEPEDLIQQA